jgi:hypothetical protein
MGIKEKGAMHQYWMDIDPKGPKIRHKEVSGCI